MPRIPGLRPDTFLLLAGLVGSFGCGSKLEFEPAGPNDAPDPSTYGPYRVGVRTLTFVDASRPGPSGAGARTLVTEIWYPAEASEETPVSYQVRDFIPAELLERVEGKDLGAFETIAVRDALVSEHAERYPLVVFSHGSGALRVQSPHLTVALASHGYVVAAPDHQGNTLTEVLVTGAEFGAQLQSFLDRPKDLSFVINQLRDLPKEDPLHARADLAKVGAVGHSFGGVTALRMTALDPRVRVAVPQAPAGYSAAWLEIEAPLETIGKPILLQAGGKDTTVPPAAHADSVWAHMGRPRFYLTLETAGHFTFSDLCGLDPAVLAVADEVGLGGALEDGCGPENVSAEVAVPLLRHFTIGFLNAYLRDSDASSALLSQAEGSRLGGDEARFLGEP